MIGGQINIGLYNADQGVSSGSDQAATNLVTSVSLSKFSSPTLFKGFGFTYSYNYSHNVNGFPPNEQISRSNGIGFFVSGTKLQPLAKKCYLGFTGTSGVDHGFGEIRFVSTGDKTKLKSYTVYVSGSLGLFYQLNQRFFISTNLINLLNMNFFVNRIGSGTTENNTSSFNFSSGLSGFSLNNLGITARYLLK